VHYSGLTKTNFVFCLKRNLLLYHFAHDELRLCSSALAAGRGRVIKSVDRRCGGCLITLAHPSVTEFTQLDTSWLSRWRCLRGDDMHGGCITTVLRQPAVGN